MDEIEKYRDGVERRRGDRRLKTMRRRRAHDVKPPMFDVETVLMFLTLVGFGWLILSKN